MSSSVTSSLLKSPPCTTKYRLKPLGPRIGGELDVEKGVLGGSVAFIIVARGTTFSSQFFFNFFFQFNHIMQEQDELNRDRLTSCEDMRE